MRLFRLLTSLDDEFTPERCQVHLACRNGAEDPLDVYLAGDFDHWQAEQNQKSFARAFVVSLIALRGLDRWLFAGTHGPDGCGSGDREWAPWSYTLADPSDGYVHTPGIVTRAGHRYPCRGRRRALR